MSFTGNEDHRISLQEATRMTKDYQKANPNSMKAHFFGKKAIQDILNQDNCVGIRIYYAQDANGKQHLVVVGADADENDLYNGLLAERSVGCPPICPNGSPL